MIVCNRENLRKKKEGNGREQEQQPNPDKCINEDVADLAR